MHHPVVFNTQVDGKDAYATSDLLLPHPTKPGLWKIYGRKDDQIMLSTGEKTNPGPLGMDNTRFGDQILMLDIGYRGYLSPGSTHPIFRHVWQRQVPEWRSHRPEASIRV